MKLIDGMKMVGKKWEYYLGGRKVSEREYRKVFPLVISGKRHSIGGTPTRGWPMKSEALAVHPDQVDEANARNKSHGIGVEYEPGTGKAILPDNAARKRLLKLEGYRDKDGFGL